MNTTQPIPLATQAMMQDHSNNSPDYCRVVDKHICDHKDTPGGLLPLLHAIQDEIGHIPPECVPRIAKAMNLSRAEVHGVITYYRHFRAHPVGRRVVEICQAEACRALGATALFKHAQNVLACSESHHSADGEFTLEPVYCLGLCASAPSMRVNERLYARLSAEKISALLKPIKEAHPEEARTV